jgi:phage-related protein
LALGIDGNSGVALTAAQRLADQVSEKMREALKIHSPSRVMRDKIGRFIPEGVAVGIDKYANKAYQSIGRLSDGLLRPIVPEFAAGGYSIGATSGASQIINNNYSSSNNNLILEAIDKLSNRPIVTNIDVDGTNIARTTSKAMTQQQYYDERTDSRMRGVLI